MLKPSAATLTHVLRGTTLRDVRSARRCLGWWFADWRVLSDTDDGDGPAYDYILVEPLKATCLPTYRIDRNYRQDPSSAGVDVMDLDDDSGALVGTFKTIPEAVAAIREAVGAGKQSAKLSRFRG